MWAFIAHLVEYCSANAEATGSNAVEAPGYHQFRNCLNCDSLRWSHILFKLLLVEKEFSLKVN